VSTSGPAADAADAEVRGVRRIFLVGLAAALIAAAVAFTVELANNDQKPAGPTVSLLPSTFRQPGFVDRDVRRLAAVELPATTRRGVLRLPGGDGALYVVARCDTGRIRATLGALSTAQLCRGSATGVVVLSLVRHPAPLDIRVSAAQKGRWALGVYR